MAVASCSQDQELMDMVRSYLSTISSPLLAAAFVVESWPGFPAIANSQYRHLQMLKTIPPAFALGIRMNFNIAATIDVP
jgi:hypothetical protein